MLASALKNEKARKDADSDVLEVLGNTILRPDATTNAWEKAAASLGKLAAARAQERLEKL